MDLKEREAVTDELNLALIAGFEIKEKYRCYKCILNYYLL